jgi:hypothetical protein
MTQAQFKLRVAVSLAWWLKPYLYGVILTARLTGAEPDMNKVGRMVRKAVRAKAASNGQVPPLRNPGLPAD